MMRIGSLFSGIGGLELGLEAAISGAHTVWQVESAPFPRSILARHWPDADRSVCDVRLAGAHNLEPVEVICGGFPCQDISTAGLGAGLDGAKSGLWTEYARIIRELRPRYVVIENVSALIVRGLERVLGTLAELGYDAEWSTLSAADVGAPHLRRRLFIIAWLPVGVDGTSEPMADGDHARPHHQADDHGRRPQESDTPGRRRRVESQGRRAVGAQAMADGGSQRRLWSGEPESTGEQGTRRGLVDGRGLEPGVVRASHGLSSWLYEGTDPERWEQGIARTVAARSVARRAARLRGLGNAVVPQAAYEIGLRIEGMR